jgi:hypothetical protein
MNIRTFRYADTMSRSVEKPEVSVVKPLRKTAIPSVGPPPIREKRVFFIQLNLLAHFYSTGVISGNPGNLRREKYEFTSIIPELRTSGIPVDFCPGQNARNGS